MPYSVRPHRRQPTRLRHPWDSPGRNTGVGCHFLLPCMKVKSESEVAQSCLTLSDPMDRSPPGSSIHGIFQARVLEWVAIAFSIFSIILRKSVESKAAAALRTEPLLRTTTPLSGPAQPLVGTAHWQPTVNERPLVVLLSHWLAPQWAPPTGNQQSMVVSAYSCRVEVITRE